MSRFVFRGNCIIIGLLVLLRIVANAQYPASLPFKTLDVTEGLPQSFISGLVQDSAGFIWIGTRDGLARYDGRKFKLFMHKQGDTTTLANNIIANMHLDRSGRLWILYETGDVDLLYTGSEHLLHFSKHALYGVVTGLVKSGNSIVEDASGNIWFLCTNGGVFVCNPDKEYIRFYSGQQLGCAGNRITGISPCLDKVALITDTALVILNADRTLAALLPYRFNSPRLHNQEDPWGGTCAVLTGQGDIVIRDAGRLVIYMAKRKAFREVPLPQKAGMDRYSIALDEHGQVIIVSAKELFILSRNYELVSMQRLANKNGVAFVSVLVDRSGILWLGGNGSGIQLHDLRPSGLSGSPYAKSYHQDLLEKYLHVPADEISHSFLAGMSSYSFRWLAGPDGKIWISGGGRDTTAKPAVLYYSKRHLVQPSWQYSDTSAKAHLSINALALSKSGKLWGMDFLMHPVFFDTSSLMATVYPAIVNTPQQHDYSANSIVMEGESGFWISTAFDGLYFYDHASRKIKHYTAADVSGALPSNQLMNIVQDPDDPGILWIGSLGGGLIKFNKQEGKCHTFTMKDGLPNNTIYAIAIDGKGNLWCSTNKGIFSFDRKKAAIRSFTSSDGLPCDEFNRYHYFQFPDGRLSFGGVTGLTVFRPSEISSDNYQPHVALTGISINNVPRDFGLPGSPLNASINSLKKIVLPYKQNFLSFEMASLQYSITEKLQYRYMLEGFDRQWVYSGTNNIATYTNIPAGNYLLKVNATNTAGKWSTYVKTLAIVIQPPFWRTAWFIILVIIATGGLVYLLVHRRIKAVRKEEQQHANFERQATALKEQALRAQMNPHFIFNCLNSIKVLIQEDNKKQAVIYLTTFSKLIRNQLNNAQALVSLQAELETCRLYVQLEALRFGDSIVCEFVIDGGVDPYSIQVPPLIIQPFIENAIWHGILPRNGGKVTVTITQAAGYVTCLIDDDGIGRQMSMSNKSGQTSTYESKGMKLVQSRLNLHNTISQHGGTAQVVDKKDAEGNALGTQIILKFSQQQ
jgi:ligand-binding sensor domain-containing protein